MIGIAEAQEQFWFVLTQPIGFGIFMIASLAELNRPPFDMPVADSEIIFGAYTEYTGLKFAFFLLAEYGGIVALAAVATRAVPRRLPGRRRCSGFIPDPLWMAAKIGALSFFIIWLRATYPRLREDQLQRMSWLALIPLALVQIMVVAVRQGRGVGGRSDGDRREGRRGARSPTRGCPVSAWSRASASR